MTPIVCIGNQHIDKKLKEIMKVCLTIELKTLQYHKHHNLLIF